MTDPTLHFAAGWYWWRGDYDHREIPKAAGFDYHAPTKLWRTRNVYAAARLIGFAEPECADRINAAMAEAAREVAAKGIRL